MSPTRDRTRTLYDFGDGSFQSEVEITFESDGSLVSFKLEVAER
jgi:hypothetical protein